MIKPSKDDFLLYNERFLASLMKRGLKLKAYKKYEAIMTLLKEEQQAAPQLVLFASLLKISPIINVRNRLRGRVKIPYIEMANKRKQIGRSVAWVVRELAKKQKNRNPSTKKIVEILQASLDNKGDAIAKRSTMYDVAKTLV